jgi:hypothetical protein
MSEPWALDCMKYAAACQAVLRGYFFRGGRRNGPAARIYQEDIEDAARSMGFSAKKETQLRAKQGRLIHTEGAGLRIF